MLNVTTVKMKIMTLKLHNAIFSKNNIVTTVTCQWKLANKMTYIQFGLADNANGRNNTIS
jgi:hypothetical protein